MLAGPNVEATAALAERLTTPVIASGGVASLDDLRALKARAASGIAGVISRPRALRRPHRLEDALAVLRD